MFQAHTAAPRRLFLDLPTTHLTSTTRDWVEAQATETALNGTRGARVLDVGMLPHGWFMRALEETRPELPEDLYACMKKARELGCEYLLFDTDAAEDPMTGDLPLYEEDDTPVEREIARPIALHEGEIEVFVLCCANPDDDTKHKPQIPSVYPNAAIAEAAFKDTLRSEWDTNGPEGENGEKLPFPDNLPAAEINDLIAEEAGDAWGQYAMSGFRILVPPTPLLQDADPLPAGDGPRILATFNPQAWTNDQAVAVDAEGPTMWDVTETVIADGREAALAIRDNRDASDALRESPRAPNWIRTWRGPFYIEVESAISDYYDAIDAQVSQAA